MHLDRHKNTVEFESLRNYECFDYYWKSKIIDEHWAFLRI